MSADDSASAQANAIVSHPTMPLLITGHEDKHIRIFDINTGACLHFLLPRTLADRARNVTQASARTRCSRTWTR